MEENHEQADRDDEPDNRSDKIVPESYVGKRQQIIEGWVHNQEESQDKDSTDRSPIQALENLLNPGSVDSGECHPPYCPHEEETHRDCCDSTKKAKHKPLCLAEGIDSCSNKDEPEDMQHLSDGKDHDKEQVSPHARILDKCSHILSGEVVLRACQPGCSNDSCNNDYNQDKSDGKRMK